MREPFTFTITDAARFLGKSPVTLRKWEREGFITYPRLGADRIFGTEDLRALLSVALQKSRISISRQRLAEAALTILELIERENRCSRTTRGREE